jgi:hypothetical protein
MCELNPDNSDEAVKTQNHWISGLVPRSGILDFRIQVGEQSPETQ